MIHEEICTCEVCKLAKEKGFPQEIEIGTHWTTTKYYKNACIGEYFVGDIEKVEITEDKIAAIHLIKNEGVGIVMPTHSELQRWLREEKGLHITVPFDNNVFWWQIKNLANGNSEYGEALGFDTYELALEDALKNALEIM